MQSCNRSKSHSSHHSGIWVLKDNCLVYKNWQPRHKPLFTVSFILSLSFIMQAPSHITTFLSPFHFKKSYIMACCLTRLLKYSQRPVAMVKYGIITYIRCLDTADYYHQCGRRNAGRTSAITYDLKSIVNRLTNKAVSPWQMDSPTNAKNCSCHLCTI